jgi:hypothetical protein
MTNGGATAVTGETGGLTQTQVTLTRNGEVVAAAKFCLFALRARSKRAPRATQGRSRRAFAHARFDVAPTCVQLDGRRARRSALINSGTRVHPVARAG